MLRPDCLVCIPYYECEEAIIPVLQSVLQMDRVDVLIVDDQSSTPVVETLGDRLDTFGERVRIVRANDKVYSGGGKNWGIREAISRGYRFVLLLDADVVVPDRLMDEVRRFFAAHPDEAVVAPAIEPDGGCWQRADTLINFSSYLTDPHAPISYRSCLAGYAFALQLSVFARSPCFHLTRFGGEDVLFFREVGRRFHGRRFPVLNTVPVRHLPSRDMESEALNAQLRYAKAFFTHNDSRREWIFVKAPVLHWLTPRWLLMMGRLLRRHRWSDLGAWAKCWRLDICRANHIIRLHRQSYRDSAYRDPANRRDANAPSARHHEGHVGV